jgi:hypothetical protein
MKKRTTGASTRTLTAVLSVTNLLSFVLGVSVAGGFAVTRVGSSGASARTTPSAVRAKAATPSPKKAVPRSKAAAAASASALYGSNASEPAPMPIAGKGMWIWQFNKIAGGNPRKIVNYAVAHGLSHLYVRSGSSNVGLKGWNDVARILPLAHKRGLKVIAWDFPYLRDPAADVRRAAWVMSRTVNGGHSVDGFAADVETKSEGTVLTRGRAQRYSRGLRAAAHGKFLVLVPPRPNPYTVSFYPYDVTVPYFDAVAPMVYWGSRSPVDTTDWAIDYLGRFGKPVAPIGQSFDMGPEGGPKGPPGGKAVINFMQASQNKGAVGVSFWSWQHTPARLWHTISTYRWKAPPGLS